MAAAGKVTISFDIKILEKSTAKTAVAYVKWNGVTVYTIYACDNGKSVSLQLDGLCGVNTLTICAAGGPVCQICVCNICVSYVLCTAGVSGNLVKNGDFQNTTCTGQWCAWRNTNFSTINVPGWYPSPMIEVGQGSFFNPTAFPAPAGNTNYVL